MAALTEVFANKHDINLHKEHNTDGRENHFMNLIDDQLYVKGIHKDFAVIDLYLANEQLTKVRPFVRFKYLQRLWLNNNKLYSIRSALKTNLCLVELYLQNNELKTIDGCLRHLRNLQVLMLQNNQLSRVDRVVGEMVKMQDLRTLNIFNNPVAQETDYRSYIIHYIPSVTLLDRSEILTIEREAAKRQYDQEFEQVKDTIAFGRRSEGPPSLFHPRATKRPVTVPAKTEVGNNYYRSHPPFENSDEAFNARCAKKSVMQFSYFDWSSVPPSAVRRTSQKPPGPVEAQIITVKFR